MKENERKAQSEQFDREKEVLERFQRLRKKHDGKDPLDRVVKIFATLVFRQSLHI